MTKPAVFLLCSISWGLVGCQSDDEPAAFRAVEPVCVEEAPADDDDVWTCGETRTVSCEDSDDDLELTVVLEEGACAASDLQGVDGPFDVGEHEISIEDASSGGEVCEASLVVVDEQAPTAATTDIYLWPPNHKYVEVDVDECLVEIHDCDDDVSARILWVSSDEPDNERGDGNTDADVMVVDEVRASLRSERQGGSNGRVYTIGVELQDDSGNLSEVECRVIVAHDQGDGGAVDDGPAYVVEWDA